MAMSQHLLHTINRLVEELSEEECKRLVYLCGVPEAERCGASCRETLRSVMEQTNPAFLMELMLRMRRYDLLRCVLGTTKTEAEGLLKDRHRLSEYRVLMDEVSENMSSGDLKSLVFLLKGTLPMEKADKCECFLDIVTELEKLDQISSGRTGVIEQCLRAIHRVDLAKRLAQYQNKAETPEQILTRKKAKDDWQPCISASQNSLSGIPSTSFGRRPFVSRPCTATPQQISSQTNAIDDWRPCLAASKPVSGFPSTSFVGKQVLSRPCASSAVLHRSSASQHGEGVDDVYRMQSNPRGLCVIIDCVGAEGGFLEQVFRSLHFRVSLHSLLSVQDMLSTLQDISRQKEHYEADAFVCCIISRNCSSGLLGTDPGPRSPGLNLDFVRKLFTPEFCPGLVGKPKLFFIQTYEVLGIPQFGDRADLWDHELGELETDSPVHAPYRHQNLPSDADVFWSHCSTDEDQLTMVNHTSVYLQSLTRGLQEGQRRRRNIMDIHMNMNRAVYDHNYRNPNSVYQLNLRHTLRKGVCLS